MIKILEGQITFGGMHDALDAVARHKNVKHGVIRITSNSCSGLIGVFCGRFITGAVLTLTGDVGYTALRKLLAAKDGTFALMDVTEDPVREVNQSLGVDLQTLLSSVDFSLDDVPLSEGALTSMSTNDEEVRLIDTAHQMEPSVEALPQPERINRINQTYQRIMSVSAHERQQVAEREQHARGVSQQLAEERLVQQQQVAQLDNYRPSEPALVVQHNNNGTSDEMEFTRLKDWNDNSQRYVIAAWVAILLAVVGLVIYYGPTLATIIGSIVRH